MKHGIFIFFFLLTIGTAFGQVTKITKIYVNGRELEVVSHGPPYFEFNEFDTTLTKVAQLYIDDFGKEYNDSLLTKRRWVIELTPGLTVDERKRNRNLGKMRMTVIMNYLEKTCRIDKAKLKRRFSETITDEPCVAFVIKEKGRRRLTRKEKKELKFEEDIYFKTK